jgi:hypothetical protein
MVDSNDKRAAARTRAQSHFTASERRDATFREEMERERHARDAKTARLRELRLAKEAVDKEEADRIAAEKAAKKAVRAPRKVRVKVS